MRRQSRRRLSAGRAKVPSRVVTTSARSRPGRSGTAGAALCAAVLCALALFVTGCEDPAGTAAAAPRASGPGFALMQMNLCLSGLAGCYARVHYPVGVEAAAAEIRQTHPDAVTFNEACGG